MRTSRGMEPTPRAASIYPEIQEALARIEKARGTCSVFSPSDSDRGFLTKRAFMTEGHIAVSTSGTGHAIIDRVLACNGVCCCGSPVFSASRVSSPRPSCWHERFHKDAGNVWLRNTMAELFSGRGKN